MNANLNGQVADSLKYKTIQPNDFFSKIHNEKNSVLIDVREFIEFRLMRLEKAINISYKSDFTGLSDTLNKETPLLLYCTRGVRSARAAVKLYDLGFRNLYSLQGGIENWRKSKLPVIRKKLKKS
jgi:phage shock protein E